MLILLFLLALVLFGLGIKFILNFLMKPETDLKDLILSLLFIDNGLGVCFLIYFLNR